MLQNFMSLLSMAGSVAGLLSEYYLYWGLDERIIPHAYNYPARRIRWCLYAPLLGAFAASTLILTGLPLPAIFVAARGTNRAACAAAAVYARRANAGG